MTKQVPEKAADANLTAVYNGFVGPYGTAVSAFGHEMAKAVADWQQEVTSFVGLRAERDKQAARSAAKCGGLPEFLQLQQAWVREAAADYLDETRKLQKLGTQIAKTAWSSAAAWRPVAPAAGE